MKQLPLTPTGTEAQLVELVRKHFPAVSPAHQALVGLEVRRSCEHLLRDYNGCDPRADEARDVLESIERSARELRVKLRSANELRLLGPPLTAHHLSQSKRKGLLRENDPTAPVGVLGGLLDSSIERALLRDDRANALRAIERIGRALRKELEQRYPKRRGRGTTIRGQFYGGNADVRFVDRLADLWCEARQDLQVRSTFGAPFQCFIRDCWKWATGEHPPELERALKQAPRRRRGREQQRKEGSKARVT